MMKKVLVTCLAAVMCAGFITLASAEDVSAKELSDLKFGLSYGSMTEEQWVRRHDILQGLCDENGIELMFLVADGDSAKQYQQCESMISSGVDVLIVRPIDSEAAGAIADMAEEEGIYYISFDTLTTGAGGAENHFYVTFDSVQVGRMQAESLLEVVPEGNYCLINGNPASFNAQLFYQGSMEVLQPLVDSGKINIVCDQWTPQYDNTIALKNFENCMTAQNNDVQAVLCCNDSMANSICAEIDSLGLTGQIAITGQDADLPACQRIVEGKQTMTIYKSSNIITRAVYDVAVAAALDQELTEDTISVEGNWTEYELTNGKPVKTFRCNNVLVTKDNIDDTVIADGWQTKEDVYANVN